MIGPLSVLWICACSDQLISGGVGNSGVRGVPDLAVWPEVLVFDETAVGGETVTEHLTIENVGEEVLSVDALDVTSSLAFAVEFSPFGLEPGDQLEVPVHFTATAPENTGRIWVESNDPDAGYVTVELEGPGRTAALEVDPIVYDFGNETTGCSTEGEITLRSYGGVPVTVDGLELLGERFEIQETLPIDLGRYDEQTITVVFAPEVAAAHQADLYVTHSAGSGVTAARVTGQGNPILELEDVFWQGPFDTTDVLVYVDRSGSMADDARNLAENFGTFAATLDEFDSDWQVGVLTQDTGCLNDAIFTSSTTDLEAKLLHAVEGPYGIYTEKGLHLVWSGMQSACNDSLLREGSRTAVIYLSDEPDQSPYSWETYLLDMWMWSPSIVTHAIVSLDDPSGYEEMTLATGGMVVDIKSSWGADLADLAAATVGERLETFPLSEPADPDSVVVTVDGFVTDGWTLDTDQRSVTFDAGAVPESGEEVRVQYTSGDTCSW
ncbi:MAG: choice-of-anchor D domain-containing protein [Proteobacteria bacterium]|nr:choice-of-anchor D domain-containing protein [Pseudomonadota bacterium]